MRHIGRALDENARIIATQIYVCGAGHLVQTSTFHLSSFSYFGGEAKIHAEKSASLIRRPTGWLCSFLRTSNCCVYICEKQAKNLRARIIDTCRFYLLILRTAVPGTN